MNSQISPKLQDALDLSKKGLYVTPLCWPTPDGECACPVEEHHGYQIGTVLFTDGGIKDSSREVAKIETAWSNWPGANIGVDLGKSRLICVTVYSPGCLQTFKEKGLPPTATVKSGEGPEVFLYFYRRSQGTPLISVQQPGEYMIQAKGCVVAPRSLHLSGRLHEWSGNYAWGKVDDLPSEPDWAVQLLKARWDVGYRKAPIEAEAARLFPYSAPIQRRGNTWRDPHTAQLKRRKLYCRIVAQLEEKSGAFYETQVPRDDWCGRSHKAIEQRIKRVGGRADMEDFGYAWFDNFLVSGVMKYLTDVPIPGFDLVTDCRAWVAKALAGISPPAVDATCGLRARRFRPCGGWSNWITEEDKDERENIGQ